MKKILFGLFVVFVSLVSISFADDTKIENYTDKELITRAKEEGLITSIKSFRPNSLITREESAYWIVKMLIGDDDGRGSLFKDDKKITKKYRKAVYLAYSEGFLSKTNGMIYPKKYLTPTELLSGLECCIDYEDTETIHNYLLGLKSKHRFVRKIELLRVLNMIYSEYGNSYSPPEPQGSSLLEPQGISPEQKQKMLLESQKKLDEAKKLWDIKGLQQYIIKKRYNCGGQVCFGDSLRPFSYEVNSGIVVSGAAVFTDTTGGLVPNDWYKDLWTVESYFGFIQTTITSGTSWGGIPDNIQVVYDPLLGYPKNISIDRYIEAADDEIYMNLELIPK